MEDIKSINESFAEVIKKLSKNYEDLFRKCVKETLGFDIDLEDEAKRRFKRFDIERVANVGVFVYYNDGSPWGRLIAIIREDYRYKCNYCET